MMIKAFLTPTDNLDDLKALCFMVKIIVNIMYLYMYRVDLRVDKDEDM